jgi:Flp pilus assembly protein TadD
MALLKRQEQVTVDSGKLQAAPQVETLLKKAVALDAKCFDANLQLGIMAFKQHNYEQAISFYQKAIEVNPQLGEAHYRLAVVYDRLGESAKAKQEFQLHTEIESQQAAAVERQRSEVKQFLIVLQSKRMNSKPSQQP